jgi:hypothetical protein
MSKQLLIAICLLALTSTGSSTQSTSEVPKELLGTWAGSWEGMGQSGGFELTLEKGKEGGAGRVSVTGEPAYTATIRTMSFEGKKMTAAYDFPPDEQIEIVLNTTFEGDSASGPWTARARQDKSEVASGTLKLKKK